MRMPERTGRSCGVYLALAGAVLLSACGDILEVDNPNSVLQEDLEAAVSVSAAVNGALSATARAMSVTLIPALTFSDEYNWVGSFNHAADLSRGNMQTPSNDYLITSFNRLAQGRWMSDNAVRLAEEFRSELPRPVDLPHAYLFAGINYLTIAEHFEDFVIGSDRRTEAPPVGPANMVNVFDTAIARFTSARTEAQAIGNAAVAAEALALRARARYSRALWQRVQPAGSTPSDPWVSNAEAVADINQFFTEVTLPSWRYVFTYSPTTVRNAAAQNANQRNEMRVGTSYGTPDASGLRLAAITLQDPIVGVPDPALVAITSEFITGAQDSPLVVTSARELRLILAEAALVAGDEAAAVEQINLVRAQKPWPLDDQGEAPAFAYDPAVHTDVSVGDMIRHERRVNLFLISGRRMWDMYRFGETSPEWISSSVAVIRPGSLFTIPQEEMLSNCHILGSC